MNNVSDIFKNKTNILEFIEYLKNIDNDFFIDNVYNKLSYENIVKLTDLININEIEDILVDVDGNTLQTRRNPLIKYPHKEIILDPLKILLKYRCQEDIIFFCENFYKIKTVDGGDYIKFKLRTYQKTMLNMWSKKDVTYELTFFDPDDTDIESPPKWIKSVNFKNCKYSVTKCGRQQGKSVTAGAFICHQTNFYKNKRWGVISKDLESACELLGNAKNSYEQLPFWLKQGVVKWNVKTIEFENGSRCKAYPLSVSAGTGDALSGLIADEYAKWSPNIVDVLNNSLIPTISSGKNSCIVYISTTFGANFYKTMWKQSLEFILSDGKKGNSIYPFEFTYREIPERNNKEWVDEQIRVLKGIENFAQENCGKFLAATGTLINGLKLSQINESIPIENNYIKENLNEYSDYISNFNMPEENHLYIIIVDPNESNGENKNKEKPNAMGIQVFDITNIENGWKQVATGYISGNSPVHYLELAPISYFLAKYFNNAVILIENNISGKEIGNKIYNDYMYENVYSEKEAIFGYRLKQNKLMLCKMLKIMVENDLVLLQDFETIKQLKSFVKKGISYSALLGYEDDLVTPLLGLMLILLFDENTIETYFPVNFKIPNKLNILEEVYRLNPTKNEQFETMCDLVIKIQEEVKNEWDKLFDESNRTLVIPYNNYNSDENKNGGFY